MLKQVVLLKAPTGFSLFLKNACYLLIGLLWVLVSAHRPLTEVRDSSYGPRAQSLRHVDSTAP